MEHWESYVLGALGLFLVVASLVGQVAAIAHGRPGSALAPTLGVVVGASLYRAGYRLLTR